MANAVFYKLYKIKTWYENENEKTCTQSLIRAPLCSRLPICQRQNWSDLSARQKFFSTTRNVNRVSRQSADVSPTGWRQNFLSVRDVGSFLSPTNRAAWTAHNAATKPAQYTHELLAQLHCDVVSINRHSKYTTRLMKKALGGDANTACWL